MRKLAFTLFSVVALTAGSWAQTKPPIYLSGYSVMQVSADSWNTYKGGTVDPNGTYTYKETLAPPYGLAVSDVYENAAGLRLYDTTFNFGAKGAQLIIGDVTLWTATNALAKVMDGTTPWIVANTVNRQSVDTGTYTKYVGSYDFTGGTTSLTSPMTTHTSPMTTYASSDPWAIRVTEGLVLQNGDFYPEYSLAPQ